ncbi:MAG: hypothetical protein SNH27_16835, partial [Rikenellaceae bacterium]
ESFISLSSLKKYFISFPATFPIPQLHLQVEFREDKNCFEINLGMVEDAKKSECSSIGELQEEFLKFRRIESELYRRVITQRNRIRLENCYNRSWQQMDKLNAFATKHLEDIDHKKFTI